MSSGSACHSQSHNSAADNPECLSGGSQILARGRMPALPAVLVLLLIRVTLEAEIDETADQFRVGQTSRGPEFGVHADGGESGHGIDLVQINFAVLGVHEEVHASEARTINRFEGSDGQLANLPGLRFAELGGNEQLGAFVEVLGVVVVKFLGRYDLARKGCFWSVITED